LKRGNIRALARVLSCCLLIGSVFSFCDDRTPTRHPLSPYVQELMVDARKKKNAGLVEEAKKSYSILLHMAKADQNDAHAAECLMSLGSLLWEEGEIDKAAKFFLEALNVAKANHRTDWKRFCEGALDIHDLYKSGRSFRDHMEFDSAERCYLRAIDIARRIGSAGHEAKCLRQLSIVWYYKMEWERFYQANRSAFELSDKNNHLREKAHCAFNIAYYYLKTARYHDAYVLFDQARIIYRRLRAEEDEVECDHNIALIRYEIGDFERALKELCAIVLKTNDEGLKTAVLISLGNAAKKLALMENNKRRLYEAASFYRSALNLAIRRQDGFYETAALNNLGYFYYELDKLPLALSYFLCGREASRRIPNADLKCTVMANIANVYLKMKQYPLAEKHYERAVGSLRPDEHQAILWEAFFGLGRCHEHKRRWDLALSCYLRALDMLEDLAADIRSEQEKANFLINKYEVYEAAIGLLFDRYQTRPENSGDGLMIISVIDRLRSRTLLDFLINKHYVRSDKRSCRRGREAGDNAEAAVVTIDDQVTLVPDNTALLIYYIGDTVSLLALVTADRIQCFPLPSRDKLEKLITRYLKLLSGQDRDEFQGLAAAHGLFTEIFVPGHERRLAGMENIVVIPDGILSSLPFETLIANNTAGGEPVYLMDYYRISYAPSLSSLHALSRRNAVGEGPGKVLMVGKSDYREYDGAAGDGYLSSLQKVYAAKGFAFNPLPGVRKEISGITSRIERGRASVRLDDAADEEFLKHEDLSDYRIIHFACHGLIDETNPLRSSLILTRKRGSHEDGRLEVPEISRLDLQAELVVLSACQTGRGKLSRGEGIMGLAKTFFYAGARSVLSTLWNVDDESTAVFMKHFYSHLSRGLPKNEALRRAKHKMIESGYAHPYYWAPFVLSGDYASSCRLN